MANLKSKQLINNKNYSQTAKLTYSCWTSREKWIVFYLYHSCCSPWKIPCNLFDIINLVLSACKQKQKHFKIFLNERTTVSKKVFFLLCFSMKDICTHEVWNIAFLIIEKFDISLKDCDFVVRKKTVVLSCQNTHWDKIWENVYLRKLFHVQNFNTSMF